VRPLLGRNDEIDVPATETIRRLVGDAIRVNVQLAEPIPPCDGGCPILERAHGLEAVEPRIAHGYVRIFRTGGLAEPRPGHLRSVRPIAFIG
jgi:hypothetical protein